MSQDCLTRIAELEAKLSFVAETESFLRSAQARAEDKIENEELEIEHLRAQIEKLHRQVEETDALLKQQEQLELVSSALKVIRTVRVKKTCPRCYCIVEAPAPSRPINSPTG